MQHYPCPRLQMEKRLNHSQLKTFVRGECTCTVVLNTDCWKLLNLGWGRLGEVSEELATAWGLFTSPARPIGSFRGELKMHHFSCQLLPPPPPPDYAICIHRENKTQNWQITVKFRIVVFIECDHLSPIHPILSWGWRGGRGALRAVGTP
jgi:hypothetical protein